MLHYCSHTDSKTHYVKFYEITTQLFLTRTNPDIYKFHLSILILQLILFKFNNPSPDME